MTAPNPPSPSQPPIPPTSGGTPSTGAPDGGTPQPRANDGTFTSIRDYRYTASDGVASYLIGKTPLEAAQLTDQLAKALATSAPTGAPPAAPPPQPVGLPDADTWLTSPHDAFARGVNYIEQNRFRPALDTMFQRTASVTRQLAEMRHADAFKRWGPEIDLQVKALPAEQQTPEAYEMVVKMVRGAHAEEIEQAALDRRVEEIVQKRLAAGGSIRPDGSVAPSGAPQPLGVDLNSDTLPDEFRRACLKAEVDPAAVDRFLLTTKYYGTDLPSARKKYLESISRGYAVAAGESR